MKIKIGVLVIIILLFSCKDNKNNNTEQVKGMETKYAVDAVYENRLDSSKAMTDEFNAIVQNADLRLDSVNILNNEKFIENINVFKNSHTSKLANIEIDELIKRYEIFDDVTIKYKWEVDKNAESPFIELNRVPLDLNKGEIRNFKIPIDGTINGYLKFKGGFGSYSFSITDIEFKDGSKGSAKIKPVIKDQVENVPENAFIINVEN